MIKIFRTLLLTLSLLFVPQISNSLKDKYYKEVIGSFVAPVTSWGRRYCSGSHMKHNNKTYFVTNRHCCRKSFNTKTRKFNYKTMIESHFNERHNVLKISDDHDVCISTSDRQLGLPITTDYKVNDTVYLIGYPRGMARTVRKGDLFDIDYSLFPWLPFPIQRKYLHISATSYPGNSGSPVVNSYGQVVGLLFAGMRGIHTEGYVVPSEYIVKAIEEIK